MTIAELAGAALPGTAATSQLFHRYKRTIAQKRPAQRCADARIRGVLVFEPDGQPGTKPSVLKGFRYTQGSISEYAWEIHLARQIPYQCRAGHLQRFCWEEKIDERPHRYKTHQDRVLETYCVRGGRFFL